ncbi:hypothetical protein [Lactococcus garvieae]|nr:hypothetical protein [Lactococcus garvieae]
MSFLNLALAKDFISVLSDGQITENEQAIRTYFKKFANCKMKLATLRK